MTQEEIQQKAYEVYPLDLDRHLIIEGEPYDNNRVKREAYIRGLTDSKPELPSNLDEAAKKYELSIGSQDYCYMDIEDAFKAGAEWQKSQMLKEAVEAKIYGYGDGSFELVASWLDMPKNSTYKDGQKVRIIIVKED